ncbi:hypothetical protein [Ruegeria marina]|uniref:SGNH hydrolase-type esterase domain-containing protein n=1 Tax=Ruegeria marina TaxID=639004 RepID=A0A1G7CEV0_9RHOB|nr:hypothetical protein [Ruegeria marina]SDE37868.1 hypothetical protein SAMN04488239_11822 [Ruegeria marina]
MSADLFLIGDSHIIALCEAADARGWSWQGGPLGTGMQLEQCFWRQQGTEFVYTGTGENLIGHRFKDLLTFDGPIISTLGFNSHRFAIDFASYAKSRQLAPLPSVLSDQAFADTVRDSRRNALAFYRLLSDHSREVYFTCSPQRVASSLLPVLRAFEDVLIDEVAATGARFIDFRHLALDDHVLRPEFCNAKDQMHGNAKLGGLILDVFEEAQFSIAKTGSLKE